MVFQVPQMLMKDIAVNAKPDFLRNLDSSTAIYSLGIGKMRSVVEYYMPAKQKNDK